MLSAIERLLFAIKGNLPELNGKLAAGSSKRSCSAPNSADSSEPAHLIQNSSASDHSEAAFVVDGTGPSSILRSSSADLSG